jgi:hypothetical protein
MFLTVLAIVLSISIFPVYIVASAYEDERKRLDGEADEPQDGHQGTPTSHMPETPQVTASDRFSDHLSDRSPVTAKVTESDRVTAPNEEEVRDILTPLSGMTLADFKKQYCPDGGCFMVERLHSPEYREMAYSKGFDFLTKYGKAPLEMMVWFLFGLTKKGGNSPHAQKYQIASDFCKRVQSEFYVPNW